MHYIGNHIVYSEQNVWRHSSVCKWLVIFFILIRIEVSALEEIGNDH